MVPLYKRGEIFLVESWRQLEVPSQLALIQESVLSNRVKTQVRAHLSRGQSGYVRDVGDPQLVLQAAMACIQETNRCAWTCFGDLLKAFPHTWREALVMLMHDGPGLRCGALALLGSVLQFDVILVRQSGASEVRVDQGVPEGGVIGPLGFTQLPDVLVKDILAADYGVGLDVVMPDEWASHIWIGAGCPDLALVDVISLALRGEGSLPSVAALESSATLEASALRALDRTPSVRVAALLHADDPVFIDSTRGALQGILGHAAAWCHRFKASFHVGPAKTVVQVVGDAARCLASSSSLPVIYRPVGGSATWLLFVEQHKWLGLLWRADLDLLPALRSYLGR